MDITEPTLESLSQKPETIKLSLSIPKDLQKKISYIKSKTFLSKKQIVMMCATPTIEAWCKELMDKELAIRTARMKVELPMPAPSYVPMTSEGTKFPFPPNFLPPKK